MSRQSGKKLAGVFTAALLATLGVGTLPAIAASDDVTVQSGIYDNDRDGDHDGDHDGHHDGDHDGHHDGEHHKHHKHHKRHHHEGKHEGKEEDQGKEEQGKEEEKGKHDGREEEQGKEEEKEEEKGKHEGKEEEEHDGKHEGKHEGEHHKKHHGKHHKKHKHAFRLATSDGKRCVEASGKLERCKHDDPDQLWFRKEGGGSTGWRLVNVGEKTCLGAHPGRHPDIKQEKCTDSLRQKWIPFGGPGMEKAPFVNAKFRSKALGRDDRVELTSVRHAPKWQWLRP